MNVSQVMTPYADTVALDASMADAARMMYERNVGCVPVTDGARKLAGIVTDRDIAMTACSQDRALSQLSVRDAMTSFVQTISQDASLTEAERLMRDLRVRRLPVVDESGRCVGMLSVDDIVVAAARRQDLGEDGLAPMDIVETLAAVSAAKA